MLTIGTTLATFSIATPAFAYIIRRHFLRPGTEPLMFILACFGSYGLLLASLPFTEAGIESHMYSFDLDGNGSFDKSEMTPEAEAAIKQWSSDVGRNLAPFTGMFLAPAWCAIMYACLALSYSTVRSFLGQIDRSPPQI